MIDMTTSTTEDYSRVNPMYLWAASNYLLADATTYILTIEILEDKNYKGKAPPR